MEQLFLPPVIAGVLMAIQWFLWGRQRPETVAIHYEPPKDVSVLECGILIDDAVNTKDIALEIYNLYVKNILILKDENTFVLNPDLNEQTLQTLTSSQILVLQTFIGSEKGIYTSKQAYESMLKNVLQENTKNISELGMDFIHKSYLARLSTKTKNLKFQLYDIMTEQGYFAMSPFEQRKPYFAIGSVIFAGPLTWNIFSLIEGHPNELLNWSLVIGLCLAGLIIAFTSLFMVKKTEAGQKLEAAFLGLKMYILTAESDRIKFVLQNDIDAYRALLPYAALFDSLDRWLAPLNDLQKSLDMPQFKSISDTVSAMDVDLSMTEKSRWLRAILDLFIYGSNIIAKLSPRRNRDADLNRDDFL
jgi:hypothetical protein